MWIKRSKVTEMTDTHLKKFYEIHILSYALSCDKNLYISIRLL